MFVSVISNPCSHVSFIWQASFPCAKVKYVPNCFRMHGAVQKLSTALSYNNSCKEKKWMWGATHAFVHCTHFSIPHRSSTVSAMWHTKCWLESEINWRRGLWWESKYSKREVTSWILFYKHEANIKTQWLMLKIVNKLCENMHGLLVMQMAVISVKNKLALRNCSGWSGKWYRSVF